MEVIDLELLRTWVGKKRLSEELIGAGHARLMAATVDYPDPEQICDGQPLPPLWHWTCFLEGVPSQELGTDGHPARGGFMPPVPLSNRMWAGGRVTWLAPLLIGSLARKESSILSVDHKQGRSGDLVFVTVLHELYSGAGDPLIREEQDIVYKGAIAAGGASPAPPATVVSQFSQSYTPTSTMLFRYSALTFNGHRIHYDVDYCREVEGYHNLVIHGPLNATMLAQYAEAVSGRRLLNFSYRGLAPALLGSSITLHADCCENRVTLTALLDNGTHCMQAEAVTQ